MNTALGLVIGVAGCVAVAWTALGLRLFRLARGEAFHFLEPVEPSLKPARPRITAIIPARNEERYIESTIESLRKQDYPSLSLIVIDDQSTDSTASIIERLEAETGSEVPLRLIRGVERPEGWVGKTWAVHQGSREAISDWLWFVDADMGLHPSALSSAVAEAEARGADFVSLLPGVECRTFWQGAIAASFLQLLGQLYPLDRVNDPARPEAIAAGGFILVRREIYERAGGHEAVRSEIIEDIQLSLRIKRSGGKLFVRLAPVLVWTHMYGGFGDIWRGMRKNAYAGMDYLFHKFMVGALCALLLAWMPWITLFLGCILNSPFAIAVGCWGALAQVLSTLPILFFLRLPWPYALSVPAGLTAYVAIASSSVWNYHRGRILWKDRSIPTAVVKSDPPAKA